MHLHIHTTLYSHASEPTKTAADTSKSGCDRKFKKLGAWQWLIKFDKCTLTKVTMTAGFSKLIQIWFGDPMGQKRWEIMKCNILNSVSFRSLTGIWCLDLKLISLSVLWQNSPGMVVKKMYPSEIADDLRNDTIKWRLRVKRWVVEMKD